MTLALTLERRELGDAIGQFAARRVGMRVKPVFFDYPEHDVTMLATNPRRPGSRALTG